MRFKKWTFVSLLILSFVTTAAQDSREIIDHYLDTVSFHDIKKWDRVKSLYIENVVFYYGEGVNFFGADPIYGKMFRQWPDKTKEELYSDSTFTNLTSEFLFLKTGHTMRVNNMPIATEVRTHLWFEFFPVKIQSWIASSKSITYHGTRQLPNEYLWCHEVEIITDQLRRTLYFNVDTNLLEAIFVPEGDYLIRLSDYKTIDGYLVPTKETTITSKSAIISFKKYNKVVFNQNLPDKIFDKLKGDL